MDLVFSYFDKALAESIYDAVDNEDVETLKELLKQANAAALNWSHPSTQDTPLLRSCVRSDCLRMLSSHPNIDINKARKIDGISPLHRAVLEGKIDAVKILASHPDILINKTDNYGQTPLHLAGHRYFFPAIFVLLSAGADFSIQNIAERTVLDRLESKWAAMRVSEGEKFKYREALNTARNTFLTMKSNNLWTPIARAAWTGDLDGCIELIKCGASPHAPIMENCTALDLYGTAPFTYPPLNPEQHITGIDRMLLEVLAYKDSVWGRRWSLLRVLCAAKILPRQSDFSSTHDTSSAISPIDIGTPEKRHVHLLRSVLGGTVTLRLIVSYV